MQCSDQVPHHLTPAKALCGGLFPAVAAPRVAEGSGPTTGLAMTFRRLNAPGDPEDRSAEARNRSTTSSMDTHSVTSAETTNFKPLNIFIKHLEDTAMEVQRQRPSSMPLMYDTNIIEEAALSFTRHCAAFDPSTMNF
ncbi:hypothetical protein ACOMHN_024372 [Nucella lapillus]